MSIRSPSIIDISSDSGEEFVVHPSNLLDIEEKIRVGGPRSDIMTACVGSASATLFASEPEDPVVTEIVDTAGIQIERQIMDNIEEHHFSKGIIVDFLHRYRARRSTDVPLGYS